MGAARKYARSAPQTAADSSLRGRATEGGAVEPGMVRRGPAPEGVHVAADEEWRDSRRSHDSFGLPRIRGTMARATARHESGVPV